MLNTFRQVRGAFSLLNPQEIRRMCAVPPEIGLVAATPSGYAAMEDFLLPAAVPHRLRELLIAKVHRAGDPGAPESFDVVLYDAGLPCPAGCFAYHPGDPALTVHAILEEHPEMGLTLARHFVPFRKAVVDGIVQSVCRENALFALASALPNIIPNFFELPWAVGEFASDTAFITMNQVRMCFLIAAATGKKIGFAERKMDLVPVLASAFGWRAIARELAGKIPLGGGLIPKAAIAYAGSYVLGKGLERLHGVGRLPSAAERRELYAEGLAKGHRLAQGAMPPPESAAAPE